MSAPLSNRLLEALPPDLRTTLQQHLKQVPLPIQARIYDEGKEPRFVHFMLSGIASVVMNLSGGDAVEVGLIGREGFPEKTHVLGPQIGITNCFMQVEGTALRMEFQRFLDLFHKHAALQPRVLQYVQHDSLVMGQLVACNRLHNLEERLARWLLMVHDRVEAPELHLTQEVLAQMLGTRRSSVNLAMGSLQRSGVLEYRRAHVHVTDRTRLEGTACECYPVIRDLYRALYK